MLDFGEQMGAGTLIDLTDACGVEGEERGRGLDAESAKIVCRWLHCIWFATTDASFYTNSRSAIDSLRTGRDGDSMSARIRLRL